MGSCLSISVAAALYYNERTCSSCRRVLNRNRDKYICLQNQKKVLHILFLNKGTQQHEKLLKDKNN